MLFRIAVSPRAKFTVPASATRWHRDLFVHIVDDPGACIPSMCDIFGTCSMKANRAQYCRPVFGAVAQNTAKYVEKCNVYKNSTRSKQRY